MCSLFSQGECIKVGGAGGNEDIDDLMRNEANDDFDDDGHEDSNIAEALHDTPHILFFMNLVGTDDVVCGQDLYDHCLAWSDVTPEFAKGMVFKDKDAVIRAYPDWKITSIVKNNSGFTVLYKKAWLGRTKAIAMVFGDWDVSYEKLPRFMRTLELRNPRTTVILETLDLGIMEQAGTVHQVHKFDEIMDEIKNLGTKSESAARAYHALCNEDPTKWTLAHDGGYRWGVITPNDSECYNNVLRGARDLPITSCVEVTFYRLVLEEYQAQSMGHHVTICNWASGSTEVVTSAAGTKENHKHAVYLNPPSCDYGKWMIYHYPCSHMLTVCAKSGKQPWHLIDPKYSMDVYTHVYDTSFEPMVHEHYWAAYDGPMDDVGSSGPMDGTVLTLQAHHQFTWIWEHGGTDVLTCRRCDLGLYDRELDPRVLQYAFGVILPIEEIDSGHLRMSWLRRTFDVLLEHANDTRYNTAMHDCIDRAIYAYDRPESLQDMYNAHDMCSRSLHALYEHQRIRQPVVPEHPSTIPPRVPATSPAMPPVFPVHPSPSTSSSQQFMQYVGVT
ncbi:hypothetical protein Acr_00g0100950 [Actinidia rufa]|uniref:Uncharacterized protein n=1 Tax=Actinidia rufa TaxID=165716 RepID=A0A7J0E0A2_9ERIC|nr:hypothetical protein Acr_00g0100950 [Actinidia rufa]